MRSRGLLILTFAVVALGAFIFFVERDLPTTDERAAREDRLFALEEDAVRSMRLEWGQQTVFLDRSTEDPAVADPEHPADWRLAEPLTARADAAAVDGLVRQLVGLETVRTLEDARAEDYGLAEPALRIELHTADASEVLDVGSELPASSRRVVRRGDDSRLYVVEAPFFRTATQAPGEWRDRRLFPSERSSVQSLRLHTSVGEVLLSRRGERFWLESPVRDLADRDGVDALLSAITGFEAKRFVDEPPAPLAELGLEPAEAWVEVVMTGREEPFRIDWGLPSGAEPEAPTDVPGPSAPEVDTSAHYARVGSTVVETGAPLAPLLARVPDDWRSPAWMSLATYEVDAMTVLDPDGSLELVRDGVDWTRDGETIAFGPVNELLALMSAMRAIELRDGDPSEAPADARREVRLTARDGTVTTLSIGPGPDGSPWASDSAREVRLVLEPGALESFDSAVTAVREAHRVVEDDDPELPVPDPDSGPAASGDG